MDSSSESGSDNDCFDDANSGSEIGDGESETSDYDAEIDLENLKLDDDPAWKSSFTSTSGMVWSSTHQRSKKNNSSNDVIQKSDLTSTTEHISSVEDAFMSFMPNKILEKILDYSNVENTHKNASKKEIEEITIMELKAFIGLLLLTGVLEKSKIDLKCLWRRSPLESPIFKATMSRTRFQDIISCLRFDDKRTREERK